MLRSQVVRIGIEQANQQAKAHLTHFSNFGKAWLGMVRMTTYHYWLIYSKRPTIIIVLGRDIKEAMAMIIMTITSSFERSCMRDFRALCRGGRCNERTGVAVSPYSHRRSLLPSLSENIASVMLLERGNKDWGGRGNGRIISPGTWVPNHILCIELTILLTQACIIPTMCILFREINVNQGMMLSHKRRIGQAPIARSRSVKS
ncbi:hypothetical protein EAE99_005644 [Botrytis elliptica]|nr:hypothetical protein EAE99_005644 [Botrytis elliptica]